MEWILAAATILGGLAALWFFWDRIKSWWSGQPQAKADEPQEKLVDFNYPQQSGVQQKLEADGYEVSWCSRNNLSRRLQTEGCELVLEEDTRGHQVKLTTGDLVLIKRRSDTPSLSLTDNGQE